MSKQKKHISILVLALMVLGVLLYGMFWLRQLYTRSHRLDEALTRIVDTLSADPNYIVTEYIFVKAIEPDPMDWSASLKFENQVLQVCVRKAAKGGHANWVIQLDKLFKQMPGFLRPSRNLYHYTYEDSWIEITAVEPERVEFQVLKDKVTSLGLPRDVRTVLSPYFPERQHNQRVQGTSFLGP